MKTILTMGNITLVFLISISNTTLFSQTFFTDAEDLQDAVNAANSGETFIIENGTYNDFEASFSANGTEDNPIIIKAETIGGVVLTGESHFVFKRSSHIIVEGFVFDAEGEDTLIKLEGCNNIRISRNIFELKTTESIKWVFVGGIYNDYTFQYASHHNRIDHNIFQNKDTPGHYITIDGTSNEDESDSRQSQYDRIDHNYFRNNSPRAANEQESIRVGWSQMSMSSGFTIVEHNLFEDCDGDPEIISVKSSDNIVRHNTFRKSYGTLSLRHGNRNRVEGNYFFGEGKVNGTFGTSTIYTGGIRIYGTDHVIVNNYMEGLKGTIWDAPIALTQGDAIDGNSTNLTKHFRAERVTIAYNTLVNNTYGIEVGFDNNGNYNTKLKDITIANNIVTGSENDLVRYIDGNDQDGEITWINNVLYPTESATMVQGGSGFSNTEAVQINPNLVFDDAIWRSSETSPLLENGVSLLGIDQDIDGQIRPEMSTVGADHFSIETVRYNPLTPDDVGPNTYEDDDDTTFETLFVASISEFDAETATQTTTVTSNLDWTVTEDSAWISVTPTSGANNGSIAITVLQNTTDIDRSATVTIAGGTQSRNLEIIQRGKEIDVNTNKITVIEVTASTQQEPDNVKENTLDMDLETRWSAEGVGETITYDLGEVYDLELIKIACFKGDERFTYFDIAIATDTSNFSSILLDQSNSGTSRELEDYPISGQARYVRIIGGGNSINAWNSITEVEIYGTNFALSIPENDLNNIRMYQLPNQSELIIENLQNIFDSISIISLDGKKVFDKTIYTPENDLIIDVSSLNSGLYIIQFFSSLEFISKKVIISN